MRIPETPVFEWYADDPTFVVPTDYIQNGVTEQNTLPYQLFNRILTYTSANIQELQAIITEASTVLDITYAELESKIGLDELVMGQYYKLTDYQTIQSQTVVDETVGGGTASYVTLASPQIEPLLIRAFNTNTIEREARSFLHPYDIVYYDATNNVCEEY